MNGVMYEQAMNKSIDPTNKQRQASSTKHSVWVNASAGTGKTKILVDRLLRLLLEGIDIDKILCITYSKMAAQEMIHRLMRILAQWSIMDEHQLKKELYMLQDNYPTMDELTKAKTLFTEIIDHPNELKIQTIHSFCQNILTQFPLEASIPTNFKVIEDNYAQELKNQSIEKVIAEKLYLDDLEINNSLSCLREHMSQSAFEDNIRNILNFSEKIQLIHMRYNIEFSLDLYKNELYKYLGADIKVKIEDLLRIFLDNLPRELFSKLITLFENLELSAKKLDLDAIRNFINFSREEQAKNMGVWQQIFLTKTFTPRKDMLNLELKNKLATNLEFVENLINKETQRLEVYIENHKSQISAEVNYAFMLLVLDIHNYYQKLKIQSNFLDFNDLIMKTYQLLSNQEIKSWIMYKIDKTIDHILVDEAQDTNPMQWEIIKTFAEEFFSGKSAKDNNRTLFVVGDIKQSIYSFQGADPRYFSEIKKFIKNKIQQAERSFLEVFMDTSFRSAPGVIDFVNHVSCNLFNTNSHLYINEELHHQVFHHNKPYEVEVWPIISVDKNKKSSNQQTKDLNKNLALAIVKKISALHENQGVAYGDILILYRNRKNNLTLEYLVKFLKDKNIPVLGIDKIDLNKNMAIKDLIALAKFLDQPYDNFSLACVLKSPIFNLTDADLFNITHNYENKNLLTNLAKYKPPVYECLTSWLSMVDYKGVFDLFFHIIYTEKNISNFIQRMGIEVIDPISELINLIFDFKIRYHDNLRSFLHFMENYDKEISRDPANNKDYITLMSIHSAKGLQSKAVFLINDIDKRDVNEKILFNNNLNKPLLLVIPKVSIKTQAIIELEDAYKNITEEEYKRLLYVAITRAEEYLYICSIAKSNNEDKQNIASTWWDSITKNIGVILKQEADDFFDDTLGFSSNKVFRVKNIHTEKTPIANPSAVLLPKWLKEKAKIELSPTNPITPSKLDFEDKYSSSPLEKLEPQNTVSLDKGILFHRILEQANYLDNKDLEIFMHKLLSHHNNLSEKNKLDIIKSVRNIIGNPNFAFLFQGVSMNEVSISGHIIENGNVELVSARVDKIIKTETQVFIIEYKFSKKKDKIPANYIKQMQIYKLLLQSIYPKHEIASYLIFSDSGDIIKI